MSGKIDSVDEGYVKSSSKGFVTIGEITLSDHEGKTKIYKPKEDITSFEVALMLKLFVHSSFGLGYGIDYWRFVIENNLERHFE